MNIIVTGANGFVGSAVIKELSSHGHSVLAIDINDPKVKYSNVTYINLTVEKINDLVDLVNGKKYDIFYHFAWVGSAGPNRMDERVQLTNAQWTADSLRVAKKLGCSRFIVAGTIMEYETIEAIYRNGTEPAMPYIYGAGKSVAHMISKPLANSLDIDLVWCYITNTYGVGELSPRLINTTIRKIFKGEPLEFSAGTQNYDFIYIDDVARAFHAIGLNGKKNNGYIIGSGSAKPLKEFLTELVLTVNPKAKPNFGAVPFTGVDLDLSTFSTKKTEEDTGFKANISFSEGIRRTAEWIKEIEFK